MSYCGCRLAKWLGYRICSLVVLGTSPPWLFFVYSLLRPASSQLGFLHSVIIYNVWDQIVSIGPEMSPAGGDRPILKVYKHISTHIPHIIRYNMLNQTNHS